MKKISGYSLMAANETLQIYRRSLLAEVFISPAGAGPNTLARKPVKNQPGISATLFQAV